MLRKAGGVYELPLGTPGGGRRTPPGKDGTLGPSHRRLLLCSFLGGGILLVLADALSRTLLPGGEELPVGVVTALLGGPFFCYLLRLDPLARGRRGEST